jgi:hypothetical protein
MKKLYLIIFFILAVLMSCKEETPLSVPPVNDSANAIVTKCLGLVPTGDTTKTDYCLSPQYTGWVHCEIIWRQIPYEYHGSVTYNSRCPFRRHFGQGCK